MDDKYATDHPTPLGDVLLNYTWLIRVVGPVDISFVANGKHNKLDQEMAKFLQNSQRQGHSEGSEEEMEWAVQTSWGVCESKNRHPLRVEGVDNVTTERSSKRQKLDPTDGLETQHWIIDVRFQGEITAQLVCCYPKEGTRKIESFDFLLTRGSQSCVENVLAFLGCQNSGSIFLPTVADVARSTTLWTTEHWHLTNNHPSGKPPKTQNKENQCRGLDAAVLDSSKTTKPLTLTYEAPPGPTGKSGLDSMSLTVPPLALLRLCNDIMASRKETPIKPNNEEEVHTNYSTQQTSEPVPIVRALQCFLRETFQIHVDKFSLIKASCSAAVLGCDGRCKPQCAELLHNILQEIRHMTAHSLAS